MQLWIWAAAVAAGKPGAVYLNAIWIEIWRGRMCTEQLQKTAECTDAYRLVEGKIEDDWGVEAFWNAKYPSLEMKSKFDATH